MTSSPPTAAESHLRLHTKDKLILSYPFQGKHAANPKTTNAHSDVAKPIIDLGHDNVSNLYKYNSPVLSPAEKSPRRNPRQRILPDWGMARTCLFLSPAFSLEFCRVFAAMFMLIQVEIHSTASLSVLPLILAGSLGLVSTVITARFYRRQRSLTNGQALSYICGYHGFVFVGATLLAISSWNNLYFDGDISLANTSTHVSDFYVANDTSFDLARDISLDNTSASVSYVTNDSSFSLAPRDSVSTPTLTTRLLALAGFAILASTTGSGLFLVVCLAARVTNGNAKKRSTTVITSLTSAGACTAAFVGTIDTASNSNRCSAPACPSHVTAQAAILVSCALCLLAMGLVCCLAAFYGDVIRHRLRLCFHRNRDGSSREDGRSISARTAQDSFDECAALLQDQETSFSESQNDFSGVGATIEKEEEDDQEYVSPAHHFLTASPKRYPHQIAASLHEPGLQKMVRSRNYLAATACIFWLSCCVAVFEFYGTLYMSHALTFRNESEFRQGDDYLQAHDARHVFGVKVNGIALFVFNGLFLIMYLKRKTISGFVKSEWRAWAVAVLLLLLAILACVTGITHKVVPYFVTTGLLSGAKAVQTALLHTSVARCARTWPPVFPVPADAPSALLWTGIPFSLLISSPIATALQIWTHSTPAPLYCIAFSSVLAGICFKVFTTKAI